MYIGNILVKAISVLQENLDSPDLFAFNIDSPPARIKRRPGVVSIKIRKSLKNKVEGWKGIKKESLEAKLLGKIFVVEVRLNAEPRFLWSSVSYLNGIREKFPKWNPLIVTTYIGPSARALCRKEGVSYIDTLGNIGIFLKDGFILKESRESFKKERRELKFLFSPKSTRVIRIILEEPARIWQFQELASVAKASLGQTYNVVKKLVDEEYLEKTKKGIRLYKPAELLEQWGNSYKITEVNKIMSFYMKENVYKILIKRLADIAEKEGLPYAFTLFAGASFIIPYVRTPHVHIYLPGNIEEFVKKANLKSVASGGNVHLILPYDEGVFNPVQTIEGVKIVGKIQLYLDLLNYPARGKEQAEVLREKVIGF